jgi:hypothetical protein
VADGDHHGWHGSPGFLPCFESHLPCTSQLFEGTVRLGEIVG